ncbi:class D sortase [Candidatus Roizmanbacteria bacterium]|nr:class D sortase [Candidatus Roizmanbacteria bacterium]
MSRYVYVKRDNSIKKKAINYFSYLFLIIGSLLLFWSFYPILSFEIYSRLFIKRNVKTPIPYSESPSSLAQANSVLGVFNIFSNNLRDFTQASIWFPSVQASSYSAMSVKEYNLSIPKLNIKDAKVVVAGEDLTKSLIHYLPKSLPGEYGNVVIFGHSTLPQLYNPKDYKTIFTYLPSMEKGDTIKVKVGEIEYEYQVYDMFVVDPDEISVLEQQKDNSYLTLITCVPPGTYYQRLIIKAKLRLI